MFLDFMLTKIHTQGHTDYWTSVVQPRDLNFLIYLKRNIHAKLF